MKILKWVGIAFGGLLLLGLVISLASPDGQRGMQRGADEALGGSPTVEPTVQPTVEPTAAAQPTPQVLTVEVVPQACRDALTLADEQIATLSGFVLDILSDYADYPDEDLVDFGHRFEARVGEWDAESLTSDWDTYTAHAAECRQ